MTEINYNCEVTYDNVETVKNIYLNEHPSERNKYIIVTGGVGDFIALDYIFNFSSKNHIIFVSLASIDLKKLLFNIPINKKKYFAIYFDFNIIGKPGFGTTEEMHKHFPNMQMLNQIKKVHISDYFPYINSIYNSLIIKHDKLGCKITNALIIPNIREKFNLPTNIALISPYTDNKTIHCVKCSVLHKEITTCMHSRNFTKIDFNGTYKILKNNNLIGVIISNKQVAIDDSMNDHFINLSTKTTLLESIEIMKKCKFYIGIDSLFSIIASKIFNSRNIYIKSNNQGFYINKNIYCFPRGKPINPCNFIIN
jgi:hypothetical protein